MLVYEKKKHCRKKKVQESRISHKTIISTLFFLFKTVDVDEFRALLSRFPLPKKMLHFDKLEGPGIDGLTTN